MLRRFSFLIVITAIMITGCGGDDKKEDKKSEKKGDQGTQVAKGDPKPDGTNDKKEATPDPKKDDKTKSDSADNGADKTNGEKKDSPGSEKPGSSESKVADNDATNGTPKKGSDGDSNKGSEAKPKSDTSIAGLAQKFMDARDRRDFDGALDALKQIFEKDPKHQLAFFYPALLETKTEQLVQAGKEKEAYENMLVAGAVFRKYKAVKESLDQRDTALGQLIIYNEACGFAKAKKDTNKAIESLKWSVEMGFARIDLMESDPDLNEIRKDERFAPILAKAKASADKLAEAMKKRDIQRGENEVADLMKQMDEFESYPFKFALKNLEGNEVKLEDYKGKVLIVDIWGTWCPPCIKEIPHFIRLKKSYAERGFDIVGINYERGDDGVIEKIQDFVKEHGINYTCVVGDTETREQVPNFRGYPTTLFIDQKGTVRMQLVGYHDYAILDGIVTRLLSEGSGESAEAKKEEAKKEEAKKEEKKEEAKADAGKKDEAKKEEVKKDEAAEAKKDEAKAGSEKEEPKKEAPKQDAKKAVKEKESKAEGKKEESK